MWTIIVTSMKQVVKGERQQMKNKQKWRNIETGDVVDILRQNRILRKFNKYVWDHEQNNKKWWKHKKNKNTVWKAWK